MGVLSWPVALLEDADPRLRQAVAEADAWDNDDSPEGDFLGLLAAWTAAEWSALSADSHVRLRDWIEAQLRNWDGEIVDRFAQEYVSPLARLTAGEVAWGLRRELGLLGRLYVGAADDAAGRDVCWYEAPVEGPSVPVETVDAATLLARTDPDWNVVLILDASACRSVADVRGELSRQVPMAAPSQRNVALITTSVAVGLFRLRAPAITIWVRLPEEPASRAEVLAMLDAVARTAAPVSGAFSEPFTVFIACAPGCEEQPGRDREAPASVGESLARARAALGRIFRGGRVD